ncbi:hypothetical protein ACQ4M3_23160 [Leptolyngbya sp. AN03gr2]
MIHVLREPPEGWEGETGYVDKNCSIVIFLLVVELVTTLCITQDDGAG